MMTNPSKYGSTVIGSTLVFYQSIHRHWQAEAKLHVEAQEWQHDQSEN
jgi:hypothetical protein